MGTQEVSVRLLEGGIDPKGKTTDDKPEAVELR